MKHLISILFAWSFTFLSCTDSNDIETQCVKGKYLGAYCEGAAIQLLDDKISGKTWVSQFDDRVYENCFVASLDTVLFKGVTDPFNLQKDSTFYFEFHEGGYSRKQYNLCEPSSFITITKTSLNPCSQKTSE